MNFIDASANDNPHLNHWTNSVKFCNMNGKGYYRLEYNIWFDPSWFPIYKYHKRTLRIR
jgi:hypothetical protein